MSEGIIYIGTDEIVWQPDTKVQSFPSGLLLVERSAIARKNVSSSKYPVAGQKMPAYKIKTALAGFTGISSGYLADNITGAIDGVYIWPNPRPSVSESHVTFDVSGYGRANTTGKTEKNTFLTQIVDIGVVVAPRQVKTFVVKASDTVNPFSYLPSDPVRLLLRDGSTVTGASGHWGLEIFERTNYGYFDEVVLSFAPLFTLVTE